MKQLAGQPALHPASWRSIVNRVSIRDVARHAGVSTGTVSNIINGVATVGPEYVERVQKSIRELGFIANESARQLKGGRSRSIGLVVESARNEFFTAFAAEVDVYARRLGLRLLSATSAQDESRQRDNLLMFEELRVRGVLISPLGDTPDYLSEMHARGVPLVTLGDRMPDERFCSVGLATGVSGYLAVRHLLASGRRKVAIITGPAGTVPDRVDSARRAVSECPGATLEVITATDYSISEGAGVGEMIAHRPESDRPDGIFCSTDMLAVGVINRLVRSDNIAVPEDIAVVGHDDIEFAAAATVPITTVKEPVISLAEAAITLLEREVAEGVDHDHGQIRFTPELVIRDSAP
jgi:LacI family transcriptional regulator